MQTRAHAALTPQERYFLAIEMSDNIRDIALAGLHARNPQLSQAELMRAFLERVQGWKIPAPERQGAAG